MLTKHDYSASFPHELLFEIVKFLIGHDWLALVVKGLHGEKLAPN